MKKFNTNKLVALLAALCLMTSAFVGSTLAKYTTTADATDMARVAKWGVEITATSDGFESTYDAHDSETSFSQTVVAEEDVVAPGTDGTLTDVVLSGAPEVAVEVTYAPTLTLSNWKIDEAEYCPLEITVETETFKIGGGEGFISCTDIADLKQKVEAKITGCSKEYVANTDLSTIGADAPSVSWKWAFEGNNDAKDTALGDQAVSGTAAEISLKVTTTVTQID